LVFHDKDVVSPEIASDALQKYLDCLQRHNYSVKCSLMHAADVFYFNLLLHTELNTHFINTAKLFLDNI